MPIPLCINDYNQHVSGVGIADQLRYHYDTSFRIWRPILFRAFGYDGMSLLGFKETGQVLRPYCETGVKIQKVAVGRRELLRLSCLKLPSQEAGEPLLSSL